MKNGWNGSSTRVKLFHRLGHIDDSMDVMCIDEDTTKGRLEMNVDPTTTRQSTEFRVESMKVEKT